MIYHSQDKAKAEAIHHEAACRDATRAHAARLEECRKEYDKAYLENLGAMEDGTYNIQSFVTPQADCFH